jgi:vacuolar-type H+-ATPase subunit F/Vma7
MVDIKHLDIAVIGDEDLVNGLRLAGVSRYHVIEDGRGQEGHH